VNLELLINMKIRKDYEPTLTNKNYDRAFYYVRSGTDGVPTR
jgi:hypothetical protein